MGSGRETASMDSVASWRMASILSYGPASPRAIAAIPRMAV